MVVVLAAAEDSEEVRLQIVSYFYNLRLNIYLFQSRIPRLELRDLNTDNTASPGEFLIMRINLNYILSLK